MDFALDLFKNPPSDYRDENIFERRLKGGSQGIVFVPDSPMIFVSAQDNYAIEGVLEEALLLQQRLDTGFRQS